MLDTDLRKNRNIILRRLLLRTAAPVIAIFLLFYSALEVIILPEFYNHLLESRKELIKEQVHSVIQLLYTYDKQVRAGELTLQEAQTRIKNRLRYVRYGSTLQDYFWINGMDAYMIMHPYRPDLEGQYIDNMQDETGFFFFRAFVDTVKKYNSGYVQYKWQWMNEKDRIEDKISYVELFPPWNWIVGTGVYIHDLDAVVGTLSAKLKQSSYAILMLSALLCGWIIIAGYRNEMRRILAEIEVRRSSDRFHGIFDSSLQYNILFDSMRRVVDINSRPLTYFGLEKSDIIGKSYDELPFVGSTSPARARISDALREVDEKGGSVTLTIPFTHTDGKSIALDASIKRIEGASGTQYLFEGHDISALKKAQHDVRHLNEYLNTILDSANVWVNTLDTDMKIVTWNHAAEEISGYSRSEVIGQSDIWEKLYPDPEYRESIYAEAGKILSKGITIDGLETTILTKNGGQKIISWYSRLLTDPKGVITGSVAVGRDISAVKAQEYALKESENRFKNLFDNTPDAICILRDDGRNITIAEVNGSAAAMLGLRQEDCQGLSLKTFLPPYDLSVIELLTSLPATGEETRRAEAEFFTTNGLKIPVEMTAYRTTLGASSLIFVIARDISARKDAEKKLLASLHDKNMLLREVHHRVRNNLQIVDNLITLQALHEETPAALRTIEEVQAKIFALSLVYRLLYQSEMVAELNLSEYFEQLFPRLALMYPDTEGRVTFDTYMEKVMVDMNCAVPLAFIATELVTNSLRYAFPGGTEGTITVHVRREYMSDILIRISDDGIGLPKEYDFETSDTLGHTLIAALADQINATVRHVKTEGATFEIRFRQ